MYQQFFLKQNKVRSFPLISKLKVLQKKLIFYYNDQLPSKMKNVFTENESVNPCNTSSEKLLFMPWVNSISYGTKSLRYDALATWHNFS